MSEPDDHQLLAEFTRENSEAAFAALVQRHINLVYSTALRSVGNAHAAEEVSQAVFIILAQKAGKLSSRVVVSGWLYQTTRLTTANFLRGETRRQQREQEAYMQSTLNCSGDASSPETIWPQIAPLLDDALGKLGEADRNAIVLRFFENKSLAEVGAGIGASEDAAKMRVNRALEKLRKMFTKRGVTLSVSLIAGAVSASSVQAAPVGLVKTISAVAITKGAAAGGSTLALVKGALKIMAWTKAKTAIVVGASVLLAAGTTTVVVEKVTHPKLSETDLSWADDPQYWQSDSRVLTKVPEVFILRSTRFSQSGGGVWVGLRMVSKNIKLADLLDSAYGFTRQRTILPSAMPQASYDLMLTLPGDPHEKLKQEIAGRFGYTAHKEKRVTDVLLLKVKTPGAPGLKPSKLAEGNSFSSSSGTETIIQNRPIDAIRGDAESECNLPVLDKTGLSGNYDITLRGRMGSRREYEQRIVEQLGLELVPSREPVEMLVVEKVK